MENFLVNRDNTGREIIYYPETGKKYYVEYIGSPRTNWGDQVNGTIQGNYGGKYKGSIDKKESILTKENGFINIKEGKGSAYSTIEAMHNKYKQSKQ